jgi:ATP-binding cassette subfamily C protein CydC
MKKTIAKRNGGWIFPNLQAYPWRFTAAVIAGCLAIACAAALVFTSGYLISRSALRPENVLMVYVPIVLVRTFGFGKAVVQYIERLISHDTVLRILSRLRVRLYRIIEPQALRLRARHRTGDLLGMLAEDIEQLQNVYLRLILPAIAAALIYGAGLFMIGRMDVRFALVMALYCGILFIAWPAFALLVSRNMRMHSKLQRSLAYQELTDGVFGMSDWMLSGRTVRFLSAFSHRQAQMAAAARKVRRTEWRIGWLVQCAIGGAVVMLTLWAAAQSFQGAIDPEWIAAFALVGFPLLDALVKAGETVMRATDYRESVHRLKEMEQAAADAAPSRHGSMPGADAFGRVEEASSGLRLIDVGYRYPGTDDWLLHGIDLHVPAGSRVALIGRSGSGKTTLLNLIQGELVPDRGSITIDGVSVQQFRHGASRPFAVLNQQPYLFDTTIANNIRLGRPDAADDEVREAAEMAGLGRLIAALPDGLETGVREAGARFSGGERQRIALARVLLQNRPIVLLDEPTVGLDPVTERDLLDTLFTALRGKTLLWITHHLVGMERMDKIVFLDRGRIAVQGTHQQLLQNDERYRKLYALDRP